MSGSMDESVTFEEMTTDEQILYVQDLWDRIASRPDAVSMTSEQRIELRRRLLAHQADPEAARPWAEVRADIEKSRP